MATHASKGVPRPFEPQYRASRCDLARIRKLVAEQAFRNEKSHPVSRVAFGTVGGALVQECAWNPNGCSASLGSHFSDPAEHIDALQIH